jgi:hypothetical protein
MGLPELMRRIDEIAWHEQIEHTLAERRAPVAAPDLAAIESKLQALAAHVDGDLLRALQHEQGYLVWALRLAPWVEPLQARQLAREHVDSSDARVRFWARQVADARDSSA